MLPSAALLAIATTGPSLLAALLASPAQADQFKQTADGGTIAVTTRVSVPDPPRTVSANSDPTTTLM